MSWDTGLKWESKIFITGKMKKDFSIILNSGKNSLSGKNSGVEKAQKKKSSFKSAVLWTQYLRFDKLHYYVMCQ